MSDFGLDPIQYNPYDPPLVDPNIPFTQQPFDPSQYPPYTHSSQHSSTSQSTSTTTTGTKRRKKTSPVWDHFEEEEYEEDGVMKLQARCKWPGCGKAMSTGGKGGTGHMARHIASHQAKDEQAALIQTRIGFNSDNELYYMHRVISLLQDIATPKEHCDEKHLSPNCGAHDHQLQLLSPLPLELPLAASGYAKSWSLLLELPLLPSVKPRTSSPLAMSASRSVTIRTQAPREVLSERKKTTGWERSSARLLPWRCLTRKFTLVGQSITTVQSICAQRSNNNNTSGLTMVGEGNQLEWSISDAANDIIDEGRRG
ncbi:hypothetical protein QYE76_005953 [Lolium multiflorum]|uniref:BED-type domain-containing protein n=1 Tax=Lolium multiflorum TaxID=4521 RepID=A0AAD8W3N1_LOLMU|nr:hypothetical protein QYE76_005953 [Lolium multiflorum]